MRSITLAATLALASSFSASASSLQLLYSGAGGAANTVSTVKAFEAEGRHMASSNATWTMGVGTSTQTSGQFAQTSGSGNPANFQWADAVATNFTLSYSKATGVATFRLVRAGGGVNDVTLSYNVGNAYHNGFFIGLRTRSNNNAGLVAGAISNLGFSLDGGSAQALAGISGSSVLDGGLKDLVFGSSLNLANHDWSLTGTVLFDWANGAGPTGSNTEIIIKAAEVPLVPVPAPVAVAALGLLGGAAIRRRLSR